MTFYIGDLYLSLLRYLSRARDIYFENGERVSLSENIKNKFTGKSDQPPHHRQALKEHQPRNATRRRKFHAVIPLQERKTVV